MCGITGIVTPSARDHSSRIQAMMRTMQYRGPDQDGTHFFNSCAFGHLRLSIVDLSGGAQPMLSNDKNLGIVFNGEIYGYKKLRDSLSREYAFKTHSDTEVILALYKKHGAQCVDKLPGMFAFAIWDDKKSELFCARDRFGEKPFYYALGKNGEFIFASEIKAILASSLVDPVIDRNAVAHYLKHLYVHPHSTIYSNVFTLPPAHTLTYTNGSISVERYWSMPKTREDIGLEEAAETFSTLFSSAVKSQLVADVPIGAFLSGGLDSSSIVAVASRYTKKLKTFSFGFESSASELPFAKQIAEKYHTDHHELFESHYDIADLLMHMSDLFDEPFADSSNISNYLVSKLAREHVTVVLTGDGGDELLGGYSDWYRPIVFALDDRNLRQRAFNLFLPHAARIFNKFHLPHREYLKHALAGKKLADRFTSVVDMHDHQNTYFSDHDIAKLLIAGGAPTPYVPSWELSGTVDDAMRMDLENYMPGDILTKVDRASMASSIELRAPFLDKDLASFCISLPASLKVSKTRDKILLREALSQSWTPEITARKKLGFGAPVHRWLKLPSVAKLKHEYLADRSKKIFSLLSFDEVQRIAVHDNYKTWTLLVLALWIENKVV